MKFLMIVVLALGLATHAGAESYSYRNHSHHIRSYREADLETHNHYLNVSGDVVHSPSRTISGLRPAGASAQCRDGSWSFSEHHRGTCSHHGGVAHW